MGHGVGLDAGAGGRAKLALDYGAFVGRALPTSPDHRLQGVLHKAAGLIERHLVADALLCRAPLGWCCLLLPLGGGLGDGADGPACRTALRAASTKLEKSLLCGLMARALWTAARVSGHGMRTNSVRPHCGAAHEDKVHVLWDCPE